MTSSTERGISLAVRAKRFTVVLHAQHIEVTARSEKAAYEYAWEDAVEFASKSHHRVVAVTEAEPGVCISHSDYTAASTAVTLSETAPAGRYKLYRFQVALNVTVEGVNSFEAGAAALALATHPDRIDKDLRRYREEFIWRKAMPLAQPAFAKIAQHLAGTFVTTTNYGTPEAPELSMAVTHNGFPLGEVALVPVQRKSNFCSSSAPVDVGFGLTFTDREGRQNGFFAPSSLPDLWFNDTVVTEQDIACLALLDSFVASHIQGALNDQMTDQPASPGDPIN